jgi:hypothetical protein
MIRVITELKVQDHDGPLSNVGNPATGALEATDLILAHERKSEDRKATQALCAAAYSQAVALYDACVRYARVDNAAPAPRASGITVARR